MPAASRATSSSACTAWARRSTRRCSASCRALTCRVYAPVGGYADLLAYLVRRLLENGANSSFVSVAADPAVPIADILKRPQSWIATPARARHPHIPLPRDLFAPRAAAIRRHRIRRQRGARGAARRDRARRRRASSASAADRRRRHGRPRPRRAFADRRRDRRQRAGGRRGDRCRRDGGGAAGFAAWNATPVDERAAALMRAADLIEQNRGRLIALLQSEGGKTLDDCVSRSARGGRFLPLLRRAGAPHAGAASAAGPDRREQRAALSRPRRLRLHQPVEFPAGDLHRPGRGARSPPAMPWSPSPPSRRR